MGRPREFEEGPALDRAMEVFWRRGYEGATLPELTEAMGISRPSLYAAFGNKEQLFKRALDHYVMGPAGYVAKALAEPTARGVVEALFAGTIGLLTDRRNPGGCLVVQGALSCGEEAESVRNELAKMRESGVKVIRDRLERAKEENDLPSSADCCDLARFVATVIHGMSVQAAGGVTKKELERVASLAMKAWPT